MTEGSTWKPAVKPHHDSTAGEHGFVSLVPMDHAGLMAVWLDSRNFKNEHDEDDPLNEMQLMARIYGSGNFGKETVLDPRTCDCCQTSAVKTKNGIFVAYRDRSEKEIRDISFVRYVNNQWTAPKTLHPDGWQISGCPVNGPAAAAWNGQVIVSWFTAAGNEPHVNAALSFDDGRTFGKVLRLDEGNPSGRVDTEFLPDGSALVSWIENSKTQGPHIMVRRIFKDGTLDTPIVVVAASTGSELPRMGAGNEAFLAWQSWQRTSARVACIQPKSAMTNSRMPGCEHRRTEIRKHTSQRYSQAKVAQSRDLLVGDLANWRLAMKICCGCDAGPAGALDAFCGL